MVKASGTNLAIAEHHILQTCQALNANRPAGMELVGRNANFGA
jgi:hypothetical protein